MRSIASAAPARKYLGTWGTLATADDDGLKTSVASSTSAVSYSGAGLNGALITAGALNTTVPRNVTVTKAAQAGAYTVGSKVRVTFEHWLTGYQVTETFTVTHADNAETFTGCMLMKPGTLPAVAIEAQADTDGSWKIGVGTAVAIEAKPRVDWILVSTSGDVYAMLAEDGVAGDAATALLPSGAIIAPVPLAGLLAGEERPYSIVSIHEGTTGAFRGFSAGV